MESWGRREVEDGEQARCSDTFGKLTACMYHRWQQTKAIVTTKYYPAQADAVNVRELFISFTEANEKLHLHEGGGSFSD